MITAINYQKKNFKEIADEYMQKIGFGEQPYLLYQHNDAGHPHIHIVTTTLKKMESELTTSISAAINRKSKEGN